jgi:hypothetical protein
LKSPSSSNESPAAIQTKLQQVKELEEEVNVIFHLLMYSQYNQIFIQVAQVDRELGLLGDEREAKSRKLNQKRVQHVSTLQQLGMKYFLSFLANFLDDCKSNHTAFCFF